jgi:hypothetical protein
VIGPADERARPVEGRAFADAVTFSFGDPAADAYGVARVGLSGDETGERSGSALALLFAAREPVAAVAVGGVHVAPDADFGALDVETLATTVDVPLERWTVRFGGPADDHGFDLVFTAVGAPAAVGPDETVARAGGMAGYEQLCRVQGTVKVRGAERTISCMGQRGHTWGSPDWSRLESARTVSAWFDDDLGITLTAVRADRSGGHDDDAAWAAILGRQAAAVAEPRLSTTYDGDGRQRRAGLELWLEDEDAYPQRAAGEVRCGSTLDLGQLRLECAFFEWHMDGRSGVGRYDVLRRA